MARIEKTVFISYRRSDVYTALAVYQDLKNQGYDIFFDYRSISSGAFEQIIIGNIKARAHFLLILTPTALDRCDQPGDWLRREIETAIDEKRNIIPLLFKGFQFGTPSVSAKLTGKLKDLSGYNGLNVHEDYFDEAMERLRTQYLNIPLSTVLHPVSTLVQNAVKEEQVAADKALEGIENVQDLVKQGDGKPLQEKESSRSPSKQPEEGKTSTRLSTNAFPWRMIAGITAGLALLALSVWGGSRLLGNSPTVLPNETDTPATQSILSQEPPTAITNIPTPTDISTSPTPNPVIGSTMTGEDGITLFYIPAGVFTMGSNSDDSPEHLVNLDAFWIDQTEVTNSMYAKCVEAGICNPPNSSASKTRSSYYGNSQFNNYPVIYVNWNMAKAYCEWVDRRLPTEAEWEKAARGTDGRIFPWGNDPPNTNLLNYNNTVGDTTEVGKYPNGASLYGAVDMAGNVWEWVADWYDTAYYLGSPSFNPPGPVSGTNRVDRGGSWGNSETKIRSAYRYGLNPISADDSLGFRCVMDATP